jgi:hypothetical protein
MTLDDRRAIKHKLFDVQVDSLHTVAGIQTRAGHVDLAARTIASSDAIAKANNLFPVVVRAASPRLTATALSPRIEVTPAATLTTAAAVEAATEAVGRMTGGNACAPYGIEPVRALSTGAEFTGAL